MTNQYPITPPSELVESLWIELRKTPIECLDPSESWRRCITKAARWGADQQLKSCCEWLSGEYDWGLAAALRLDAELRPDTPQQPVEL